MAFYLLLGVSTLAIVISIWRKLLPKPYPGIPYNEESARRITGDIPSLIPLMQQEKTGFSTAVFALTTQKLGTPVAQFLFPGIRKPFIIIDDPLEIEDILHRRNKEFDKAPTAINLMQPLFPRGTLSQYTTPELRAQKRVWADVMSAEFLRKAAAPNIHKATVELLELWRLKASAGFKDEAFDVHEDFQNAALDAIWVAVVGEEPGVTRYEINRLRNQIEGNTHADADTTPLPAGMFLKEEVAYIANTFARNATGPFPKWAQKLETYTPRYRKFRRTVTDNIGRAMRQAVKRFERLEMGNLEADEHDTCMMDLVLRRQILEARRAQKPLTDPTKDQSMLDEMFVMLVGGHDSTANALTWFARYMEAFPQAQTELRAALRAAFGDSNTVPSVSEILDTDIPYLDAACEESFRLAGVAKGNLRQVLVDTEILGYKIPKGAELFMNYHIDHEPVEVDAAKRTPASRAAIEKHGDGFQTDAARDLGVFEPRRWIARDKKTGKEVFNAYALPSLAFGGGFRGCSGRKLATMEFRLVVTLLLLNFEFLELPAKYKSTGVDEKLFRQPEMPYARVRAL